MKNIHEILKEIGIEIPADKKADFDKAVNENYKTVAETEKIRTARDDYKKQLDDVSGKLKEFEGVDVNALKGEIIKLQNDILDRICNIGYNLNIQITHTEVRLNEKHKKEIRACHYERVALPYGHIYSRFGLGY